MIPKPLQIFIEGEQERKTTVVPFGQGFKDMSPPTKELMKLVLEERIAHGGHPVLRWMMNNIFIRTDPAGKIKADKEKSTEKIDGAIATIMGLDLAIRCGNDTGTWVYDSRGLLFVQQCIFCRKREVCAIGSINLIIPFVCAIIGTTGGMHYDRITRT